jgi:hypothetical protein
VRSLELLVDRLPARWWALGNLYVLPFGDWHCCAASHPRLGHPVRTLEWRGRVVARGRTPFDLPEDD